MAKYVAKRLVTGVAALLFLTFLTFVMAHKMPGNPFDTGNVSDQVLEMMEEEYGMNEPLRVQYAVYMKNLLRGESDYGHAPWYLADHDETSSDSPNHSTGSGTWNRNSELCVCASLHVVFWRISEMVSDRWCCNDSQLCASGCLSVGLSGLCDIKNGMQYHSERVRSGICGIS